MTSGKRRNTATLAIRALESEIAVRRAELATLERALGQIEHGIDSHPGRCDACKPDQPCDGIVAARYCRSCGWTVTRCEQHGGIRAAAYELEHVHRPGCRCAGDDAPQDAG